MIVLCTCVCVCVFNDKDYILFPDYSYPRNSTKEIKSVLDLDESFGSTTPGLGVRRRNKDENMDANTNGIVGYRFSSDPSSTSATLSSYVNDWGACSGW